jgi:hypothetical protein
MSYGLYVGLQYAITYIYAFNFGLMCSLRKFYELETWTNVCFEVEFVCFKVVFMCALSWMPCGHQARLCVVI